MDGLSVAADLEADKRIPPAGVTPQGACVPSLQETFPVSGPRAAEPQTGLPISGEALA